jgi:hypothetical protein
MAIGITANAEAQTPPAPYNTTVAVMVDSLNGDTKSTIDCRRDGQFETINGDATLIMVNRQPHKMICVITIRVATPVG